MNHILIRHKVADYVTWKASYDSHAAWRQSAGLAELHVPRGMDNPNEVVMLFTVADLDKVKAFATSDDLRAAMQNASVISRPDLCFRN